MSINRISLRNFKCFRNLDVDFSKITLLTGENSSGKSSLVYGLLSVFQSNGFPLYLSPNGKYVSMGDFLEMAFGNRRDNEIGIDISLTTQEGEHNFETSWVLDTSNNMPKLHHLKATSSFVDLEIEAKDDTGYVLSFNYDSEEYFKSRDFELSKVVYSFLESIEEIAFEEESESEEKVSERESRFQKMKKGLLEINNIESLKVEDLGDLGDILIETDNAGALRTIGKLSGIFEHIDSNLNFISSFRLQPERTYYRKLNYENKVGRLGENYIDQILEWYGRKSKRLNELRSILRKLGLLNSISVRKLRGGRFELRAKVKCKGIWAPLPDVGFGISQFLPIVVADLQLSRNSVLVVAQPEIHLHPSVQAALADYFVEQANEKEKRYILETHSEYLLNRIRLNIVKGKIEPSDISVYYFENSPEGSTEHKLEFTKDGQIKNAPQGFFDTYMMDVMDIALNAQASG